jgi:hypothetical protein
MILTVNFPSNIRMEFLIGFALILLLLQLLSGTQAVFAELIFLMVVLAGMAVNLLGGLRTLGGFCVAVVALKTVVISQVVKVVLWEPAHTRLENPVITAGVLVAGMIGICAAALLSRPIQFRRSFLQPDNRREFLRTAAVLTYLCGSVSVVGTMVLGGSGEGVIRVGGLVGLFRQFSFFLGLSAAFSTAHVVVATGGRRCLSWFNAIPSFTLFSYGVLTSSKEAIFDPFLFLVLTAIAFRFRFRTAHFAGLVAVALLANFVFFPFAQMARSATRGYDFADTVKETGRFIGKNFGSSENVADFLDEFEEQEQVYADSRYYDGAFGLLERVSLIKAVDLLVTATLNEGHSGWETVTHGLRMLLPRAINPHKPAIGTGNFLGQKTRLLDEDDLGTQVSFGFIADGFSSFGWPGAVLIPLLVTFTFFTVFKFLIGPVDQNVWCAYFFCLFQHQFTEQTISAMILMTLQQPLIFCATYVTVTRASRFLIACGQRGRARGRVSIPAAARIAAPPPAG